MRVEIVDGAHTRALRRAVLRPNLTPDDALPGDELSDAIHFAALGEEGETISTCFVSAVPCPWRPAAVPSWQLRQMATSPQHRGHGAGAAVFAGVLEHLALCGGGTLWCYARERAVPFYERGGMSGYGDIFTDAQHPIPHLRMWCDVQRELPARAHPRPHPQPGRDLGRESEISHLWPRSRSE